MHAYHGADDDTGVLRNLASLTAMCGVVLLAGGCGGDRAPDLKQGEAIYTSSCARCHGSQGEGDIVGGVKVPSLVGISRVIPEEDGQIAFVKNGGSGMPQFGEILSDDDVKDVVAYTRHQFG